MANEWTNIARKEKERVQSTIDYAEMLVLRMIKVSKASKVKGDHGHVSLCMGVKIVKVYETHETLQITKKKTKTKNREL